MSALNNDDSAMEKPEIGLPFPGGPMLPRPNATWPVPWSGVQLSFAQRRSSACDLLFDVTNARDVVDDITRGNTTRLLEITTWERELRASGEREPAVTLIRDASIPLASLDMLLTHLSEKDRAEFADLKRDLQNLFGRHRIVDPKGKKIKKAIERPDALFTPAAYAIPPQFFGAEVKSESALPPEEGGVNALPNDHLLRELLAAPLGEWDVLALLFVKLVHIHLAWLPPKQVRPDRYDFSYGPMQAQLEYCAYSFGEGKQAHPLASTAAGLLFSVPKILGIYARDDRLPDCLHLDSAIELLDCVKQTHALLASSPAQAMVVSVAELAQDIAASFTDPLALGALDLLKKVKGEKSKKDPSVNEEDLRVGQLEKSYGELNKRFSILQELLKDMPAWRAHTRNPSVDSEAFLEQWNQRMARVKRPFLHKILKSPATLGSAQIHLVKSSRLKEFYGWCERYEPALSKLNIKASQPLIVYTPSPQGAST